MGLGSSWRGLAYQRLNGLRRMAGLAPLTPAELNALEHWNLQKRIKEAEEAIAKQGNLFMPQQGNGAPGTGHQASGKKGGK